MDDSFIERYAEKCANDGTVIIAYIEDGVVRGAAELHPPEQSDDGIPEIAFSVESTVRRQGVGTVLFRKLISVARAKGYKSLRITTGAGNEAMRALANKFGAHLTFSHGESSGIIDLTQRPVSLNSRRRWCSPDRGRAGDREFQPRLLAHAVPHVRLGPRRLTAQSINEKGHSPIRRMAF